MTFQTLVADPPWPYADRLPGKGRGAEKHYPTLSITEIGRFPLPAMARDSWLFLWTTGAFLAPAFDVMRWWGFQDTGAQIVWRKTGSPIERVGRRVEFTAPRIGMGRTVRMEHEYVLIGRRGRPARSAGNVRSVIEAPVRGHSEKPDEVYAEIERLVSGPYVELFARRARPGWAVFGNEVGAPHP